MATKKSDNQYSVLEALSGKASSDSKEEQKSSNPEDATVEKAPQVNTTDTKESVEVDFPKEEIRDAKESSALEAPRREALTPQASAPNTVRRRPRREARSRRVNILITPSLFEKATSIADLEDISINELINRSIERYCSKASAKRSND